MPLLRDVWCDTWCFHDRTFSQSFNRSGVLFFVFFFFRCSYLKSNIKSSIRGGCAETLFNCVLSCVDPGFIWWKLTDNSDNITIIYFCSNTSALSSPPPHPPTLPTARGSLPGTHVSMYLPPRSLCHCAKSILNNPSEASSAPPFISSPQSRSQN